MRLLVLLALLNGCGGNDLVTIPVQLQQGVVSDPNAIKSYELWVLDLVGRDNQPVDCRLLLDGTKHPASPEIIVIKRIEGTLDGGDEVTLKSLPVGSQNRIFYVDMYDQPGQLGVVLAKGCAPSVSIVGGQKVQVEIIIDAPHTDGMR
jgi:hypothetical protein